MILPDKYTRAPSSLIGVGAVLLQELKTPRTTSALWERVRGRENVANFPRMVAGLDLLFLLGAVEMVDGVIRRTRE